MEQKNLARQNFIQADVGKSKAEVLANRYGRAYDVFIQPIVSMVEAGSYSLIINKLGGPGLGMKHSSPTMVISCVDTMEARRSILNCFSGYWFYDGIFLDGGNEDEYGQVIISNPSRTLVRYEEDIDKDEFSNLLGMLPVKYTLDFMPVDLAFYLNTENQGSSRSCADLDQTMAINSLIANTMFGIIQNIMYSKSIPFNRINVSLNGSTPELMTVRSLWNLSNYIPRGSSRGRVIQDKIIQKMGSEGGYYEISSYINDFHDYAYQLGERVKEYTREKREAAEAAAKLVREEAEKLARVARIQAEIAARKERERGRERLAQPAVLPTPPAPPLTPLMNPGVTIPPLTPLQMPQQA